ncbi:hypothetical protein BDW42DRAFT_53252 [Aspergillus taichungensis]|uniref:PH domain-containing protein n=1 Tax=Aspergillus taichungensis TaxID=482145 RepID=A0A2J5I2S3_9EURO|nr:hypothetical protein BDW42DRAFT_53252 [Aspergillus taichungensis]
MATALRSHTPDAYGALPQPADSVFPHRGYAPRSSSRPNSFVATTSAYNVAHNGMAEPSSGRSHRDLDGASHRASLAFDTPSALQRSASHMSQPQSRSATPTRSTTLKKKSSLSKKGSIRRSGSRKSMRAGSVRSLVLGDKEKYHSEGADDQNSAFFIPIPTSGSPTEVLANRFQAWRKILKDLILFFKELQKSYETRSKLFLSASNILNSSVLPPSFLDSGGLADATDILRDFHRQGHMEANKAAEVENEVVNQLMGLRNDLQKKTKEIRSLSGDFRNSVDKEVDATRKTVRHLHESLGLVDTDPAATSGKGDPFIVRLGVEKQIERQIEEENYLHRAFLNLENSGRELESIVVGEIQKAYNAYASILKREADEAYDTAEKLRSGPISMPHDHEWNWFISNTDELVDPRVPLRDVENISYPGKDHPAAVEVRSGMLERKSKYLKSYTPGWYVLSPTHLHEFKSADRVAWQTPVMSLYLPEQKLGSHSQLDSTSHKFMLKGRQTGTMHRGHSWVFRAESHDTMMAWYEDIESLISKTGEARNAFVRRHVRTVSGTSCQTTSASSDGVMDEDEADRTPYSPESVVLNQERPTSQPRQPGGRFPSDVQIDRSLQAPLSPSSGESSGGERDLLAAAGSLTDNGPFGGSSSRVSDQQPGGPPSHWMDHNLHSGQLAGGLDNHNPTPQPSMIAGLSSSGLDSQSQHRLSSDSRRPPSITMTGAAGASRSSTSRDPSWGPQRTRGESASTAPTTTNATDHTHYTHNTVPTSVDESMDEYPSDGKRALLASPPIIADSSSAHTTPVEWERSTPKGLAKDEFPRPGKGSVSAVELRIPGHYPPTNIPA